MISRFKIPSLLAGALCVVSAANADTIVTFSVNMSNKIADASFIPGTHTVNARGTFNGYSTFALAPSIPDTNIYTGVFTNTSDPNGGKMEYKFHNSNGDNWENTSSGQNRAVRLPNASGSSLVLDTPFFADGGAVETNQVTFRIDMAQQINLGAFNPNAHTVNVRGGLNGWGLTPMTADPSIARTNQFGLISSNVYTAMIEVGGSHASAQAYKFYYNNGGDQWEGPSGVNSDGGGNRYYANVASTQPIFFFSDAPYAPIASNQITFRVDMSARRLSGSFSNGMQIDVRGSFNGWTGGANPLTNDPLALNTNIYSTVFTNITGVGANIEYKFVYVNGAGTQWEDPAPPTLGGNRFYTQQDTNVTLLPAVFFSDQYLNDLLQADTMVTFKINMAGAVGNDAHTFNAGLDKVYVNGQFANWYGWWNGGNPTAVPQYELFETPTGSLVYSNTILIPKGTPVRFAYKYGMGINGALGPSDNEAGNGVDRHRVVRSTAAGTYAYATDTFGVIYNEDDFGALTVSPPSGGTVAVKWLGRPSVKLQTRSTLTGGSWTDVTQTDGTNWTSGSSSANGLVSQTNWPAAGNLFFRLSKQLQ